MVVYEGTQIQTRYRASKESMGAHFYFSIAGIFHVFQFLPDFERALYKPVQKEIAVPKTTVIHRTGQLHLPAQIPGLLEFHPRYNSIHDRDFYTDGDIQPHFCAVYRVSQAISEVFPDGLLFTGCVVICCGGGDLAAHI